MAVHIKSPSVIKAAGTREKLIREFVGNVNTATPGVSIAHMTSSPGWEEPGQTPDFDEYTLVLKGVLHIETHTGEFDVAAGQAVIALKGEWIRYSTPGSEGAEYVAVCLPAFTPQAAHRDE